MNIAIGMNDFLNNLQAVGARLRSERERMRMKQDDFAELGGAKRVSQSQYEGGKSPLGIEYLLRLKAHGVDIGYVVTGVRSDSLLLLDEQMLLDKYLRLSPTMREIAHVMISSIGDKPDEEKRAEANFWLASPPGSSSGTLHSPKIGYNPGPVDHME